MKRLLSLCLAAVLLVFAAVAPAQSPDLKDREIDLLKRRLEQAREQLRDERTARVVYQTQLQVAATHGLRVGDLLAYAPLTPKVLDRLFNDAIDKQYPDRDFDLYNWIFRFFGAIPERLDMRAFLKDLMTEQAGGLYDPFTKKLYISPMFDVTGALGRMVLAHEIDHALQDQNFDIETMGADKPGNDDRSAALMAMLEGDATLLMGEVVARDANPLSLLAELPKMALVDQSKLAEAPVAIRDSLLFPYLNGMAFFQGLGGRTRRHPDGGLARLADPSWRNDVFLDPPVSTEQILHPEKYLANERPAEIPALEVSTTDYPHVARDVIGEFGVRLLLGATLDPARVQQAAAGWNGDRIVVGEDEPATRHVLRWVTRWDSAADAEEFASALADALAARFKDRGLAWRDDAGGKLAVFGGSRIALRRLAPDGVTLDVSVSNVQKDDRKRLPGRVSKAPVQNHTK
jgi:hypothetical protein